MTRWDDRDDRGGYHPGVDPHLGFDPGFGVGPGRAHPVYSGGAGRKVRRRQFAMVGVLIGVIVVLSGTGGGFRDALGAFLNGVAIMLPGAWFFYREWEEKKLWEIRRWNVEQGYPSMAGELIDPATGLPVTEKGEGHRTFQWAAVWVLAVVMFLTGAGVSSGVTAEVGLDESEGVQYQFQLGEPGDLQEDQEGQGEKAHPEDDRWLREVEGEIERQRLIGEAEREEELRLQEQARLEAEREEEKARQEELKRQEKAQRDAERAAKAAEREVERQRAEEARRQAELELEQERERVRQEQEREEAQRQAEQRQRAEQASREAEARRVERQQQEIATHVDGVFTRGRFCKDVHVGKTGYNDYGEVLVCERTAPGERARWL